MKKKVLCFLLLVLIGKPLVVASADQKPRKPTPRDKCPVCGMFVYKYPDWVAQAAFQDGTRVYFDGAKDLLKFYLDPSHYLAGKSRSGIIAIWVTDYYALESIDGRQAFYVLGSDVFGPMGRELIPLAKEAEAREFLKDHRGKKILRSQEITPEILKTLE
jgi:nitrous oxide reductase accessory protein NosL